MIFACLAMFGPGCTADQLVLPANHESIDPSGAQRHIVRIHNRNVEYWVMRSPGAKDREPAAFVLFFVGTGDRADRWIGAVAKAWSSRPVELWGMNYPDSGGSDGPACLACVCPDALGIFDRLRQTAGARPVFIQAGSFGTAAALCVAARRRVDGLELQNPPSLRQLILGRYGWWNLWLLAGAVAAHIPPDLDSIANAAHCKAPAIFVLSDEDDVVSPPYHDLVVNAYAGPKRVIHMPGAKHNDPLTREAARELADDLNWVWGH